jgi:hypothetical protein
LILTFFYANYLKNIGASASLLEGFSGNLLGEILGGFLFLLLALHLDSHTDRKIDEIQRASIENERILKQRQELLDIERKIQQFDQFMATESYHNIRFPDLKPTPDDLGLEYTIEPVRDTDGKPKRLVREMSNYYVVRLRFIRDDEDDMNPERLAKYENSPIRENEYCFCAFFNGEWHLGQDSFPMHKFYLSSKIGPVENGISPNQFMGLGEDPTDMQLVTSIMMKQDGTELRGAGGCTPYKIFKDGANNLFLKIHDSSLKRIYFRNPRNSYGEDNYYFHVEGMRGYAAGENLTRTLATIQGKLTARGVEVPRIPWYNL